MAKHKRLVKDSMGAGPKGPDFSEVRQTYESCPVEQVRKAVQLWEEAEQRGQLFGFDFEYLRIAREVLAFKERKHT